MAWWAPERELRRDKENDNAEKLRAQSEQFDGTLIEDNVLWCRRSEGNWTRMLRVEPRLNVSGVG